MNYILFDDIGIKENLLPLTYFRPVSEIRCGILTLKEKWTSLLDQEISYLTDAYLQEKFPPHIAQDNIYINSSVFPDERLLQEIINLKDKEALFKQEQLIALRSSKHLNVRELKSAVVQKTELNFEMEQIVNLYDIFQKNAAQIEIDFDNITANRTSEQLGESNQVIGTGKIFVEKGARVEASIFNTENGPIYIGRDVTILEGNMIRGPFAVLNNSVVKMGSKIYEGTTLGPNSKVGGELKAVVFFGNTNKGHDGYLGDTVVGEWCNFGAGTNNSNLKNNYSSVKLWHYPSRDFKNTGLQFCGLIMGDHSKCGISTMFNTGTVVGVSANIYGGDYQPKFFPSFKWGGGQLANYRYDRALEVARIMAKRRNYTFDVVDEKLFKNVYKLTQKKEQ